MLSDGIPILSKISPARREIMTSSDRCIGELKNRCMILPFELDEKRKISGIFMNGIKNKNIGSRLKFTKF